MNSLTKLLLYYFYPHGNPRNNNFWLQRFLAICLLGSGLAACSLPYTGPPPLTPEATSATQSASTPAALTPTPAYTAPGTFTPSQYRLVATLDFAAHYLAVSQRITYTNNSAHALELIPIVVPISDELLTLTSLRHDRDLEWDSHMGVNGGLIELLLARPLLPGDELQVELEFAIAIPERCCWVGQPAR